MPSVGANVFASQVRDLRLPCTAFANHPLSKLFEGLKVEISRLGAREIGAVAKFAKKQGDLVGRDAVPCVKGAIVDYPRDP